MFAVIYLFEVKNGKEAQFIDAWKQITQLIYTHEGSLGSRLHKKDNTTYIAYAQWPNKEAWESAGEKLPEQASTIRLKMKEACTSIQTIHELAVIEDLTASKPFSA